MESATPENGSSSPSVLVVEDEPDIAALVAHQLTREGFRVETASNGQDALSAVSREIPDLVVLDRMLPGVSGDEVLRRLEEEGGTETIPILVLTAKREQEDRIHGLELGADDDLTKPFSPRPARGDSEPPFGADRVRQASEQHGRRTPPVRGGSGSTGGRARDPMDRHGARRDRRGGTPEPAGHRAHGHRFDGA